MGFRRAEPWEERQNVNHWIAGFLIGGLVALWMWVRHEREMCRMATALRLRRVKPKSKRCRLGFHSWILNDQHQQPRFEQRSLAILV